MPEPSIDPLFDVAGRSILVAGGAGGLGAPLAQALARRGAKVLIADIDAKAADNVAQALQREGHQAKATQIDVVSSELLRRRGRGSGAAMGPAGWLAQRHRHLSCRRRAGI